MPRKSNELLVERCEFLAHLLDRFRGGFRLHPRRTQFIFALSELLSRDGFLKLVSLLLVEQFFNLLTMQTIATIEAFLLHPQVLATGGEFLLLQLQLIAMLQQVIVAALEFFVNFDRGGFLRVQFLFAITQGFASAVFKRTKRLGYRILAL